jgi:hypothetical protein
VRHAALLAAACACLAAGLSACQTTQETSAMKAKHAKGLSHQKGLTVARENPAVKVLSTEVLHDANGTAAVVQLQNTGPAQAALPVAVAVDDGGGKALYRNDAPGLERSLVEMPLLRKGERAWWVNNQVVAAGAPKKVEAKVGEPREKVPTAVPQITVSKVQVGSDQDGTFAKGVVTNRSKVVQTRLTIFCVARKGSRVVAAGRAGVQRLKPGKRARFHLYFIGDPRGAKLELVAPPTVLQ